MNISINGEIQAFHGQTLADLVQQHPPEKPFSIAVNTVFVPQQHYAAQPVCEGDQIDIVRPVVGG